MRETINTLIKESIETKEKTKTECIGDIQETINTIIEAFKKGNTLFLCGNGGSAADSQHLAAELVHQFEIKGRKALPAIALTTNTSNLTALGNDWGYDTVFERQIEALGKKGDVLIGISTSGNSKNIIRAFEMAQDMGITCISFSGRDGGKMKELADINIIIPSEKTARIQESHIMIGHIMCTVIDEEFSTTKQNE